ncbi:MAG: hypothetical protein ACRCYN_08430 [Plesiomonas sp.]
MIRRRKSLGSKRAGVAWSPRRLRMLVNRKRKVLCRNRLFVLCNLDEICAESLNYALSPPMASER